MGISYLPPQPDDSHTNLEWLADVSALASHPVRGAKSSGSPCARIRSRCCCSTNANTLTSTLLSTARTIDGRRAGFARSSTDSGWTPKRYTLAKPLHDPAASGRRTGAVRRHARRATSSELAAWYSDALSAARRRSSATTPSAAPVRCWPHHFDIATLIEVARRKRRSASAWSRATCTTPSRTST